MTLLTGRWKCRPQNWHSPKLISLPSAVKTGYGALLLLPAASYASYTGAHCIHITWIRKSSKQTKKNTKQKKENNREGDKEGGGEEGLFFIGLGSWTGTSSGKGQCWYKGWSIWEDLLRLPFEQQLVVWIVI